MYVNEVPGLGVDIMKKKLQNTQLVQNQTGKYVKQMAL